MKKKTKIIIAVCVALLLTATALCVYAYNAIRYGQIKAKQPISIKTASVGETADVFMIAHRGFSAIAPENTLEAFEEACKAEFFGCEFDIHLTKDGEWVVMHDPDIKKMTGKKGTIGEMTLSQLKEIPITNGANIDKYDSVCIPTLEQALEVLGRYGTAPIIEIKTATDESLEGMLSLLRKYGLFEKAWIISFSKEPLVKLRELDGDIKMSYLVHKLKKDDVDFCLENKINGIDFNKKKNDKKEVAMITDAGLIAQTWTVDTAEDFERFYSYGVRYFTGNCLTY